MSQLEVNQPQRVRMAPAEAEERATTLLKLTDDLVNAYILDHPFTKHLQACDLPKEALQAATLDWYLFHRPLAASYSRLYKRFIQICRAYSDIEEEYLERISYELTRPKAGGRTLLLRQLVLTLGIPEAQMNQAQPIGDLRRFVSFFGRLHSEGTFAEVVAGQFGSAFEPYARLWCEALTKQCGLGRDDIQYWEINARLSQDKTGGGAMGTRGENAYLLRRAFEEGLTEARPNWGMKYAAEMAVKLWAYLLRSYVRRFNL